MNDLFLCHSIRMTSSVRSYSSVFPIEILESLRTHPVVIEAKSKVDALSKGSVYFTIPLSDSIRILLLQTMNLDLSTSVPMRWIKGDLDPHMDTGAGEFDRTHLIYLTSSEGVLQIDETSYPITEGSAYVFSEGLPHHTIGTGMEPRLLMGPMSEQGLPVGFFEILGSAESPIYLRQNGSDIEHSSDQSTWSTVYWPCGIQNTDTSNGILTVYFTTDLILSTNQWQYFIPFTSHVRFGSRSLKTDGTRPIITVDGISNYMGLIQNGTEFVNGNANIQVCNLEVRATGGSTLATEPSGKGAGWVCHNYFGKGVGNNYVIHCSSDGAIAEYGGGIVGSHGGSYTNGTLTVIGCSSTGVIGNHGGGILGASIGSNNGHVFCRECWTTGSIGDSAGGIVGQNASEISGSLDITRCYTTGTIGNNGGGIVGYSSGVINGLVSISTCYSTGTIQSNGGGIAGSVTSNTTISNCYSTGAIQANAGGIVGLLPDPVTTTLSHCYTTGTTTGSLGYFIGGSSDIPSSSYSEAYNSSSGWESSNANLALTGVPSDVVGTSWVNTVTGQPYEVRMGYTPYSTEMITAVPALRSLYEQTVTPGGTSSPAIVSGKSYTILQIVNGSPSSYGTIIINGTTGVISTTSSTQPGVYTIYLRNTGSYHITEFNLTVSGEVPCCERPIQWASLVDDRARVNTLAGNILIGTFNARRGPISYSDLIRMKMAYAVKI